MVACLRLVQRLARVPAQGRGCIQLAPYIKKGNQGSLRYTNQRTLSYPAIELAFLELVRISTTHQLEGCPSSSLLHS